MTNQVTHRIRSEHGIGVTKDKNIAAALGPFCSQVRTQIKKRGRIKRK